MTMQIGRTHPEQIETDLAALRHVLGDGNPYLGTLDRIDGYMQSLECELARQMMGGWRFDFCMWLLNTVQIRPSWEPYVFGLITGHMPTKVKVTEEKP